MFDFLYKITSFNGWKKHLAGILGGGIAFGGAILGSFLLETEVASMLNGILWGYLGSEWLILNYYY